MTVCSKCKKQIAGGQVCSCSSCGSTMCDKCASKGEFVCGKCSNDLNRAH